MEARLTTPPPETRKAWYALRRTLPPWAFEVNLKELHQVLPEYQVDELVIKIDTEEFSHGQPPLDWVKAYQEKLYTAKETLEAMGIVYSLNPWVTIGHIDRGRHLKDSLPNVQTFVGHDGFESVSMLLEAIRSKSADTRIGLMSSGPRRHCAEGRQWRSLVSAVFLHVHWEEN